jgi:serine/threonine protein kinase
MRSLLRRTTTLRGRALGAATDFLDALLAIHPDARPTATAALAHPWLQCVESGRRFSPKCAQPGTLSSSNSSAEAFHGSSRAR